MHPHGANSRRPSTRPSWQYGESIGDRWNSSQHSRRCGVRHLLCTQAATSTCPHRRRSPWSPMSTPTAGLRAILATPTGSLVTSRAARCPVAVAVEFVNGDYTQPLPVPEAAFDLLISLYAGPFWDQCQRYLKPSGLFLANSSHGDASLAALDPRLDLVAAVIHRDGRYRLDRDDLARYLIPKKPAAANPGLIRQSGRGIAYTRAAFAYVFQSRRAPDPPSCTGRL